MRTRSPIYHDESPKRPPPSPSNKPPPPKKLDAKSRAVSEEPCPPSKVQAAVAPSSDPLVESCTDKVCRPVSRILGSRPLAMLRQVSTEGSVNHHFLFPKSSSDHVVVDMKEFMQILELDEGDDQGFARDVVEDYLKQTQGTIELMDKSLCAGLSLQSNTDVSLAPSAKHDLIQLSKYGHFLKGSSAALGVVQVKEICEKIQHLGNRIDPDKEPEVKISADDALARIKPLLARLKDERAAADEWMKKFFK